MTLTVIFHIANGSTVEKTYDNLSWETLFKETQLLCFKEFKFVYQDGDSDTIVGTSKLEWESATSSCFKGNVISIFQAYSTEVNETLRMENLSTVCCRQSSSGCCNTTAQEENSSSHEGALRQDDLVRTVNPTLNEYKYTGESLRAATFPLGPIGGGNIAIAGDGGIRQWQVSNKVNHVGAVPDSFFAVKCGSGTGSRSFALQSKKLYDAKGFTPAPIVTDHVIPAYSIQLLNTITGVSDVEIIAKYPVVEVDYLDAGLPVQVHLEAWSPKIPSDAKNSAIPVVVFDFHVKNTTAGTTEVSLLGSLQNLVGWNGVQGIGNEVYFPGYGGNCNSLYTNGSLYGLNMSNTKLPPNDPFNGNISLIAVKDGDDEKLSTMLQYTTVASLWKNFTSNEGLPGQGISGESTAGTTFNGALSFTKTLKANETKVYTFLLAWYFPNRYRDWNLGVTIPNTNVFVGNYYAKLWKNVVEVLEYTNENLITLRSKTYKFRDAMFNSTLPWQLIDSAAGRVSVLNSPTCMWHADGNMYAFEGCSTLGGCCPLNCTHVWNYEMALALLYPDVEKTMRDIELRHETSPYGVVPSRVTCPLELARQWTLWPNFQIDQGSTAVCVDGEMGTVLKTYREVLHGATIPWLGQVWAAVKRIMNHWMDVLDQKKNGLVFGPQPSTYDVAMFGYNPIMGCLYLCGLRAAEEMSKLVNDGAFEKKCHDRFALGTVNLDKECYTNGKWYTQVVNPKAPFNVTGDGTFVGMLYGQWWAHILNLGYLLPKEHIQSHIMYVYQRNYIARFDIKQSPRTFCDARDSAFITGKWDDGKTPAHPLLYSYEMAWSGVIYPFASLLLVEGFEYEALTVLRLTREFYDGTRRSPWNEIECGDHYARPMAAYAFFKLAAGHAWKRNDDDSLDLSFKPIMKKENFKCFYTIGTCWGSFSQCTLDGVNKVEITVAHGEMKVSSLSLNLSIISEGTVTKEDSSGIKTGLSFAIEKNGDMANIKFNGSCCLGSGERLALSW